MRKHLLLVATSTLIETLFVLSAAAVEMRPGLWELTTQVEQNGAGSTRPQRSRCVTAEAAEAARTKSDFDISAHAKKSLNSRFGRDACKLTDEKNSRDLISWRLQCTGKSSAEQEGVARFDSPEHYTLAIRTSMTSAGKTVTSVVKVEGRHRGECPK